MAAQIENHYIPTFKANLMFLLEDKGGRLDNTTMVGEHYGKITSVVDQFGSVEMSEIIGRNQDIVPAELSTDRRHLDPRDWDVSLRLERRDKIQVIADPSSKYAEASAKAARRKMDQAKIDAFFADAKTGQTGSTTTSFDSTNQVVAVDEAANSVAVGFTVDKLKKALSIFTANEVDFEEEEIFCLLNGKQNLNMLRQIEVIHGDYTKVAGVRVEKGFLREYMGVNFIHKENIKVESGTSYQLLPMWCKSGMYFGMWPEEIMVDATRLKTKRGHPWQLYTAMTFNATRTEEKKVIQIKCV